VGPLGVVELQRVGERFEDLVSEAPVALPRSRRL
jgi:hypothetical protein